MTNSRLQFRRYSNQEMNEIFNAVMMLGNNQSIIFKEDGMPKVGKKKFPYTKEGEKAAKKESKKTGKKVTKKSTGKMSYLSMVRKIICPHCSVLITVEEGHSCWICPICQRFFEERECV